MGKEEFIKYFSTMRTVFQAVSAAASSLMEMNAMNVSPTAEESIRLQSAFTEIADHIRRLKDDAQEKVREYNAKKEESAVMSKKAIEEYTKMQEKLLSLEKENADARVALVQKGAEKDEAMRKCREVETKLEETSRDLEDEIRKARKKQKDLKKWFWVPGYGLYLAIDTLINELNNEISSLNEQLKREKRRMDDLVCQYQVIGQEMEKRSQEMELVKEKMANQIKQIECQEAVINNCKKQLLYWEDFYMQMSNLEEEFKAGTYSPDGLYELVERMEAFESAAEE